MEKQIQSKNPLLAKNASPTNHGFSGAFHGSSNSLNEYSGAKTNDTSPMTGTLVSPHTAGEIHSGNQIFKRHLFAKLSGELHASPEQKNQNHHLPSSSAQMENNQEEESKHEKEEMKPFQDSTDRKSARQNSDNMSDLGSERCPFDVIELSERRKTTNAPRTSLRNKSILMDL